MKGTIAMSQPGQCKYTIEAIYSLPDGKRAELIDGQIYYMAPPTRTHQRIVTELTTIVNDYIKKNKGKCEVIVSPFAVFLDSLKNDDKNYVEPDISIICDKDKLDDKGCHGAPDWVIEVVSPDSKPMDYYIKPSIYNMAGVREYWIVDTETDNIMVYDMAHDDAPVFYHFVDKVKSNIFEDLEIDFIEVKRLVDGK